MNNAMEQIPEAASSSLFEFFGLRENPFSISPDPRFLYVTPLTEAASQQLLDGVRCRKGLMLLTGEVGTGKTLLLRRLLDWSTDQNMPTALIFNSRLNPDDFLDFVLSEFGVACKSSLKSDKLISLNCWLLNQYRLDWKPVLIVDEAQGLPLRTLEEIRLLMNLETPRDKLLQVILTGPPELEEKLKRHELRQLRQRVTVRCRTAPLTLQETHSYIQERLRTSGAKYRIFHPEVASFVYGYSRGIPRVINVLCEHSLINACAEGSPVVYRRFVERAAEDCQLDQVESVGRVLDTSAPPGEALGEFSPICAGGMPDSVATSDAQSMDSSVLTEARIPTVVDVQACGQMRDFSSGQVVLTLEAQPASDWSASPNAMALTMAPDGIPPSLQKVDTAQGRCASSVGIVQDRPLASLSCSAHQRGRIRRAVASLFQGWWRSFSADAHSTGRQLERLVRRCTLLTTFRLLR